MARIIIKKDSEIIKEYDLKPGQKITLGRRETNTIVLKEQHISREHVVIEPEGDHWRIRSVSPLGLFSRNERIDNAPLKSGDIFEISPYSILFEEETIPSFSFIETEMPQDSSLSDKTETNVTQSEDKPQAQLRSVQRGTTRHWDLKERSYSIGRSAEADIDVGDPKASRIHAKLACLQGRFHIEDLQSSNGTFVNDLKIRSTYLSSGDRIRIGDTELLFQILNPSAYTETPFVQLSSHVSLDVEKETVAESSSAPFAIPTPTEKKGSFKKIWLIGGGVMGLVLIFLLLLLPQSGKTPREIAREKSQEQVTSPRRTISKEQQKYIQASLVVSQERIKRNDYEGAREAIDEVLKIDPTQVEAVALEKVIIDALQTERELEQQRIKLQEEKTLKDQIKFYLTLGLEHFNRRDYQAAIDAYNRVLELEPEHLEAHQRAELMRRELAQTERGKMKTAEQTQQREKANRLFVQATSQFQDKKYADAIKTWKKILSLSQVSEEETRKAQRFIAQTENILKEKIARLLQEARSFVESGDYAKARELYHLAQKINPESIDASQGIRTVDAQLHEIGRKLYTEAIIEENIGNLEGAKQKLQQVLSRVPASDEYYEKAVERLQRFH